MKIKRSGINISYVHFHIHECRSRKADKEVQSRTHTHSHKPVWVCGCAYSLQKNDHNLNSKAQRKVMIISKCRLQFNRCMDILVLD